MFDKIEKGHWWDFGWELVQGCTKISEACDNCWSMAMKNRFHKNTIPKFCNDRLIRPFIRKKPASFAIWDDLFHESVSFEDIDKAFTVMAMNPHHIFMILTKRPKRAVEYFESREEIWDYIKDICWDFADYLVRDKMPKDWIFDKTIDGDDLKDLELEWYGNWPLDNVLMGTTIEMNKYLSRANDLLKIPAKVYFLSAEPLLGPINFKPLFFLGLQYCTSCNNIVRTYIEGADNEFIGNSCIECDSYTITKNIDWIIIGSESGQNRRPLKNDWVENIAEQCKWANIPVFIKQLEINGKLEKDINKFPEHLQIRELPNVL